MKLINRFSYYMVLIRFHKPVGFFLVLWPAYQALWFSATLPSGLHILWVGLGAFLMRSAGCAINDICDKKFDRRVNRTKNRPLAQGNISVLEAYIVLFVLLLGAFLLFLHLPLLAKKYALLALVFCMVYPLTKRFFFLPQLVLGFAFSTGVLVAWSLSSAPNLMAYFLMLATVVQAIIYDTFYALMDYEDDKKLPIHTSVKAFGRWLWFILFGLQCVWLALYAFIWQQAGCSIVLGACIVLGFLWMNACWLKAYCRGRYFFAFYHHQWVGLLVLLGVVLQ